MRHHENCGRKCQCKTCLFVKRYNFRCGECYQLSGIVKKCEILNIDSCKGYIPNSFIKRVIGFLIGDLPWEAVKIL